MKIVAAGATSGVENISVDLPLQPPPAPPATTQLAKTSPIAGEPTFGNDGELSVPVRAADDTWKLTIPVTQPGALDKLEDVILLCAYKVKLP
jgi:hypothetical protein